MAGGNLNVTHMISNFPGFPEPQPGMMLAHQMRQHALVAGVALREAVEVTEVDFDTKTVVLDDLETIHARALVVATGSSPRPIGVDGEREHKGKGLSYCATCDAKYYEDKHVIVIGGGNSAIEEALFIAKFARKITIVHQFAVLQANKKAQERAFAEPKIEFVFEHEPRAFIKVGNTVGEVLVENMKTGERSTLSCDGVFIFAGMQPNLEGIGARFELDRFGYLRVDEELHTNLPGVWAAGDVRSKTFRQMTTAVSDGTIAAMSLARELGA
jgi:thioredoxin reductase (NADPH)